MDSYIFDFEKSPSFFKKFNKEWDVENLSDGDFEIILVGEECPDNIKDCLTGNSLKKFTNMLNTPCSLAYEEVNSDTFSIVLDGDATLELEENFRLKAAFLVSNNVTSKYVMGYSINQQSFNVSNKVIFEDGLVFWSVAEADTNV